MFSEDTRILMYLLKILGPIGRQHLKNEMMIRAVTEPEAGPLLKVINKLERALGQLARMSDEERVLAGLNTTEAEDE